MTTEQVTATVAPGYDGPTTMDPERKMRRFTVTLHYQGRTMSTPFFQGSAWTTDPTAAEVLEALLSDVTEADSFEEWAADLGMDGVCRAARVGARDQRASRDDDHGHRVSRMDQPMTRDDDNDRRTELDAFLNGEREVKLCLHCEREIVYDRALLAWTDDDAGLTHCWDQSGANDQRPADQRHEPELDAAERIHDHGITLTPAEIAAREECATEAAHLADADEADARALLAEMDGVRPR